MSGVTAADLDRYFNYHPPGQADIPKFKAIRDAGRAFAQEVVLCTPAGPDQTAAVRKIREAVMTANAAIACDPVKHSTEGN